MEEIGMEQFGMLKKCHCPIFEGKPGTTQDHLVRQKEEARDVSKEQKLFCSCLKKQVYENPLTNCNLLFFVLVPGTSIDKWMKEGYGSELEQEMSCNLNVNCKALSFLCPILVVIRTSYITQYCGNLWYDIVEKQSQNTLYKSLYKGH